jgi:hypothetical protein
MREVGEKVVVLDGLSTGGVDHPSYYRDGGRELVGTGRPAASCRRSRPRGGVRGPDPCPIASHRVPAKGRAAVAARRHARPGGRADPHACPLASRPGSQM